MQDPQLLEFAWIELLEKNKPVTPEELAEVLYIFELMKRFRRSAHGLIMLLNFQMIYGRADPLESYCAHFLLSQDEIYFSVLESKGSRSIYSPRPTEQVFLVHFS